MMFGLTINISRNDSLQLTLGNISMAVIYKCSKTAWVWKDIMQQYLTWLNNIVRAGNKRILLTMDNFSAHEMATRDLGEEEALSNVRIK